MWNSSMKQNRKSEVSIQHNLKNVRQIENKTNGFRNTSANTTFPGKYFISTRNKDQEDKW